jgi:hypothetical protein
VQQAPTSSRRHYLWSRLLVQRAVREAKVARPRGAVTVATIVATHQAVAAARAQPVTAAQLMEQAIEEQAQALLVSTAFVTQAADFEKMLDAVAADWEFDRLVASLVQDAGRTAESVAVTATPRIGYVRYLNPPSCSRCAVLAGRVYRYSTGFARHPNCDCTMLPTTVANDQLVQDPVKMMKSGQITDMSKADRQAILDGADFGRVVNARLRKGGVRDSGLVLSRAGRPTPAAIYRAASDRDDAIQRLIAAGYIR